MAKKIITSCNRCKEETNHTSLYSKKVTHTYESDNKKTPPIKDYEEFMVVQCKGCNTVSFLLRESGGLLEKEGGKSIYYDLNFPESSLSDYIRLLSHEEQDTLPRQLADLYRELQIAFENGANKLAGVGLRMLVEAICMEQNIAGNNLKIKIEKLHDSGLISKNEIPILDKLRDIGNSSAHEIKSFPLDKLEYALDILNHVLKSIYILPKINKKLKL